jgi:hypothetical protein
MQKKIGQKNLSKIIMMVQNNLRKKNSITIGQKNLSKKKSDGAKQFEKKSSKQLGKKTYKNEQICTSSWSHMRKKKKMTSNDQGAAFKDKFWE